MDRIEYKTIRSWPAEVLTWRDHYSELVGRLGQLGTEVSVSRTLQTNKDVAPHQFVRGAIHEFVFPPQKTKLKQDKSRLIDPTPGYVLRREEVTREFDADKVKGHLVVRYDDADTMITFSVTDVMGESELSEDVLAAITRTQDRIPASANPTQ